MNDRGAERRELGELDRHRLRGMRRVAAAGVVVAVLAAAALAALGADGRAGMAVLLVVAAAGSLLAALTGAVTAIVDEYRGDPVARPRTVETLAYFALAFVLLLASVAAGAVAGAGG